MKNTKSQSGSAHLIIIAILSIALIGALGFVFYQNFIQSRDNTDKANEVNTNNKTETINYKTYTMDKYNLSFKYPSTWSLGDTVIMDPDYPYINRSIDVKNEKNEVLASLVFGVSGIGGTCDSVGPVYTNLDSDVSSVKADKTVAMDFLVSKPTDNGSDVYKAYYGLSDRYIEKGDGNICLFYNYFSSSIANGKGTYLISFGNGVTAGDSKDFASLNDVNKYLASNEYKEIKKMILSLTY